MLASNFWSYQRRQISSPCFFDLRSWLEPSSQELIETQYIERKEGDRKMLYYMA